MVNVRQRADVRLANNNFIVGEGVVLYIVAGSMREQEIHNVRGSLILKYEAMAMIHIIGSNRMKEVPEARLRYRVHDTVLFTIVRSVGHFIRIGATRYKVTLAIEIELDILTRFPKPHSGVCTFIEYIAQTNHFITSPCHSSTPYSS